MQDDLTIEGRRNARRRFHLDHFPLIDEQDVQQRLEQDKVSAEHLKKIAPEIEAVARAGDEDRRKNAEQLKEAEAEEQELQEQMRVTDAELNALLPEIKQLEDELRKTERELEAARKQEAQVEAELRMMEDDLLQKTAEASKLQAEVDELADAKRKLELEIAKKQEEVERLTSLIKDRIEGAERLERESQRLAAELKRIEAHLEDLKNERREAVEKETQLEAEIESKETEAAEHEADAQEAADEAAAQDNEAQQFEREEAQETQQAQLLAQQIDKLDQEHQALQQQLNSIHDTTRKEKAGCSKRTVHVSREPERQRVKEQMDHNRARLRDVQSQRAGHVKRAQDLRGQARTCRLNAQRARGKSHRSTNLAARSRQVVATKKANLGNTQRLRASLENEIAKQKVLRDGNLARQEHLGQQNDEIKRAVDRMEDSKRVLGERINKLKEDNNNATRNLSVASRAAEEAKLAVRQTRDKQAKLTQDIKTAQQAKDNLANDLHVKRTSFDEIRRRKSDLHTQIGFIARKKQNLNAEKRKTVEYLNQVHIARRAISPIINPVPIPTAVRL